MKFKTITGYKKIFILGQCYRFEERPLSHKRVVCVVTSMNKLQT